MMVTPPASGRSRAMTNWRRLASRIRSFVRGGGSRIARPVGSYAIRRQYGGQPKNELKAFDVAASNKNFIAAGTFALLNNMVAGSEVYNRVGRKTYMKSIRIRGVIYNILTNIQDTGRIILLYDEQPNGAQPVIADIVQDSNAGAATTIRSNPNLNNRERFQILRDHTIYFPSVTNTGGVLTNENYNDTEHASYNIDWFVPLKGKETMYNGVNGGTIADIVSGSLYLVVVIQTTDNAWTFSSSSRLRYYD